MAEGARQYVVVGRSSARAIFSDKEKLRVNVRLADGCPGELLFRTRYINTESGTSVPGDLWVDGRGAAQSLTIAASALTNKARDVAAIIAVGVNASMGQIDAELAFDNTPGVAEREYFQMFMEAESLPLLPSRKVKSRETAELIDAVNLH